jgi:hypothetical protein
MAASGHRSSDDWLAAEPAHSEAAAARADLARGAAWANLACASELGARVRDSSAGAWRGRFGADRPRADSGERHTRTAMTSGPARSTSEVAAKRAGRSRGGSDTLSSCLLGSVGRRCGDVSTGSMHRVARAMARGVEADVRVTDPIRSGVEASDLGGACVGVEGRSRAASVSGVTSSASAIGEGVQTIWEAKVSRTHCPLSNSRQRRSMTRGQQHQRPCLDHIKMQKAF